MVSPHEHAVQVVITRVANLLLVLPDESKTSADEVLAAIKRTKNMKAAGVDEVLNLELKNLSREFFEHLATIFNNCLELSYFPCRWKLAKVIPIHKPGNDPTNAKSYRSISLLSCISKLFEKLILSRLLEFVNQNNIFPQNSSGLTRSFHRSPTD